ncbi:hypothetical protein [Hyalangium versicolor]|uniref:hypothetical protein n=1 Tax=Hyalangium versicolor TaxID=2861190 RepID=UPI001CCEB09C|nr:hypothetical protein [Hyalangium versicolor]
MGIIVAAIVCVGIAVLPQSQGYHLVFGFFAARFVTVLVLAGVASFRKLPGPDSHLPNVGG